MRLAFTDYRQAAGDTRAGAAANRKTSVNTTIPKHVARVWDQAADNVHVLGRVSVASGSLIAPDFEYLYCDDRSIGYSMSEHSPQHDSV